MPERYLILCSWYNMNLNPALVSLMAYAGDYSLVHLSAT